MNVTDEQLTNKHLGHPTDGIFSFRRDTGATPKKTTPRYYKRYLCYYRTGQIDVVLEPSVLGPSMINGVGNLQSPLDSGKDLGHGTIYGLLYGKRGKVWVVCSRP